MNKIQTYDDLLKEELALRATLTIQKKVIQEEVLRIREQLSPLTKIMSFASKFVTRDNNNTWLNTGIGIAGDIIFKNVILAKSGWLARLVLPYLVKNYSSHLLNNGDGNLFQRIGKKIGFRKSESIKSN